MENTNYYKLAILIVLYGKEVEQCETFTNIDRILKNNGTSKDNIILCLWNNGPRKIEFNLPTDYYTLKVCQTINNEPLSHIYNL
ncbi:hypothetical protein RCM28_06725, partial [Escherichia marmotae]|nr:hypothetical protein [Escherichia marmotae]